MANQFFMTKYNPKKLVKVINKSILNYLSSMSHYKKITKNISIINYLFRIDDNLLFKLQEHTKTIKENFSISRSLTKTHDNLFL